MKLGQPSVELCALSTSQAKVVGISSNTRRPRVICAAQRGQNGSQNNHVVGKVTAGRAGLQRSQAVAAPVREEVAVNSPAPSQKLIAPTPGLAKRLRSWLPWSSQDFIPLASQLQPASDSMDDVAMMGDGMATSKAQAADSSTTQQGGFSRRGWSVMSRRSSSSSSSSAAVLPEQHRPVQVDHAALQLLRQRAISKSRPGQRSDNFKLGLVVEGGGMRGCVSGGALQAIADLGLKEAFDAVYGSSAGAINGSFFLANDLDAVNIYHDHIASDEFINLRRLLSRRSDLPPALNLSFLIDHVMQSVHPLDFDSVIASEIPLKVVASSLDALGPVLLSDFKDKDDLVTALRASATVPEVAGGPVLHRGHRLVDAAVFEAVPFRSAIADGCTHVLVLCTRPPPVRKSLIDQALADAVEVAVKRAVMSPEYMVPAWKAEVETLMKDGLSQDEMLLRSFDEDAEQLPWFAGSHVFPIYPMARCPSPVCTDVAQLKSGVAEGRRSTMTVMKAILGDVMDFSQFVHEASQIVPLRRYSGSGKHVDARSSSSSVAAVAKMSSAERIMWESMDTDVSQHA
ncbi:hypothetical protein Ndes2526B_g07387 [Nannochloris sp. 'desiccata']|nr:hypothetical protein KSW81_004605 [Chlorella desiccata (nom. nud.)]KAH7618445.1 hypothetical protein NADE_000637 [Chlorella desiccata (nom. nud.)]